MASGNPTTDVAIIGGGAAGCAVAYYLAKAGVKSTLIEREGIAAHASGYNAGGLNPLQGYGLPGPLSALAAESFRMHADLAEALPAESGVEYHYKRIEMLTAAFSDEDIPPMQETLDIFQAADGGFAAHWLDADELRRMEPRISPKATRGLYAYGNASLLGYEYTLALWSAAERAGATLTAAEATGLRTDGSSVTGVRLADGEIDCDAAVIASGPWSAQAGEWLGARIPVEPLKGEIVRLRLSGQPAAYDCAGAGVTLYSRADGLLWAGATEERRGFDAEPSESAKRTLLAGAHALMPSLAQDAVVAKHTACLRPVTPDWMPIIGAAPGWRNAYLATGAGRKGILISPAIGKAIADLITAGETAVPLAGFGAERFG